MLYTLTLERVNRLSSLLSKARDLGFLGPEWVSKQIGHSFGFCKEITQLLADTKTPITPGRGVHTPVGVHWVAEDGTQISLGDLGSGGGVPGLVIALRYQTLSVSLIESNQRRAHFLEESIDLLELENCSVLCTRAEEIGSDPLYRGEFDFITARSFGRPGVLSECAAPLLKLGGYSIVSEPPGSNWAERWPDSGIKQFGMAYIERPKSLSRFNFAVLKQVSECPSRFPRRVGVPAKRPIF